MFRWNRDDDRIRTQFLEDQTTCGLLRRLHHEGCLQPTLAQTSEHLWRRVIVEVDSDAGNLVLKGTQNSRKDLNRGRRGITHVQFTLLSGSGRTNNLHGCVDPFQRRLRLGKEHAPDLSKPNGFPATLEQHHSQFFFKIPNLSGQWWLGDMKLCSRARHVLLFGYGDKVTEMAQFHNCA